MSATWVRVFIKKRGGKIEDLMNAKSSHFEKKMIAIASSSLDFDWANGVGGFASTVDGARAAAGSGRAGAGRSLACRSSQACTHKLID